MKIYRMRGHDGTEVICTAAFSMPWQRASRGNALSQLFFNTRLRHPSMPLRPLIHYDTWLFTSYCWWFRNPTKPVEVGQISHYLRRVSCISGGCLGFLPSTVPRRIRRMKHQICRWLNCKFLIKFSCGELLFKGGAHPKKSGALLNSRVN